MEEVYLNKGDLLNEKGQINEAGYAFSLIKKYNKENIKGLKHIKLKEWNYYIFLNETNGVCVTISNLSYAAMLSVTYLDFTINKYISKTFIKLLPNKHKFKLPHNDTEKINVKTKNYVFSIIPGSTENSLYVCIPSFADGKKFIINLGFKKKADNSIVTVIPFQKPGDFYYNEKSNLLVTQGNVQFGNKIIDFPLSYGTLDWGRGVWPYKSTWYWSNLNVKTPDGDLLGFNLGYGLGDNSKGTENTLFFNNDIYKLNDVEFVFTKDNKNKIDYSKEIHLKSKSGDIDLTFTPLFNRHDHINLLIIESNQNQVFGRFKGKIKANDQEFEFNNYLGFLEKVINKY